MEEGDILDIGDLGVEEEKKQSQQQSPYGAPARRTIGEGQSVRNVGNRC